MTSELQVVDLAQGHVAALQSMVSKTPSPQESSGHCTSFKNLVSGVSSGDEQTEADCDESESSVRSMLMQDSERSSLSSSRSSLTSLPAQENELKIYNLGSGAGHSVLELIKSIAIASGQQVNYEICPRRRGDAQICVADPSLAWEELGWRTKKTLADVSADTLRFRRSMQKTFEPVETALCCEDGHPANTTDLDDPPQEDNVFPLSRRPSLFADALSLMPLEILNY